MPIRNLIDPKTLERVPLADAARYFEDRGLLPAEAVRLCTDGASQGETRSPEGRPFVSPSICDPTVTCRRQIVIERFLDYDLNPLDVWMAKEGTVWHEAFERVEVPGWQKETWLPDAFMPENAEDTLPGGFATRPWPKGVKYCPDGKWRLEVWPGVWMRGRIDRHTDDWSEVADFKTQRPAKTDYGLKAEWTLRLNIYARMIRLLTGKAPERLWVWRMLRGAYESQRVFRKFPVPVLPEGAMEKVGEFARSLQGMLEQAMTCPDEGALRAFIATVPMDGEKMFNGKKCTEYCAVNAPCFQIAGRPTF